MFDHVATHSPVTGTHCYMTIHSLPWFKVLYAEICLSVKIARVEVFLHIPD